MSFFLVQMADFEIKSIEEGLGQHDFFLKAWQDEGTTELEISIIRIINHLIMPFIGKQFQSN